MAMKVVLVDCLIHRGLLRYLRRHAAASPDRDEPIAIRMKRAHGVEGREPELDVLYVCVRPTGVIADGEKSRRSVRSCVS